MNPRHETTRQRSHGGRVPPLALGTLGAALLLGGCVSARPWRDCYRPCDGRQLRQAEQVQIFRLDGSEIRLTGAKAGADETGVYLAGSVKPPSGKGPLRLRVYSDEICSVRTRRVEFGRVAANAVLVPVAVAANLGLALLVETASDGEGEFEPVWELPSPEPPPSSCTWKHAGAPVAVEPPLDEEPADLSSVPQV